MPRKSFGGFKNGHAVQRQLGGVHRIYFILTSRECKRVHDGGALWLC